MATPANTTPHMSFEAQQSLMQYISGDNLRASTSAGALESIKLLAQMDQLAKNGMDPALEKVYKFEKEYLQAGINAITSNALLAEKFGQGLDGAQAVASFLKMMNAQKKTTDLLNTYLPNVGPGASSVSSIGSRAGGATSSGGIP